ncbi:MAG TPA: sulfatase-like hydrolase/transferase [Bryobacteraceae bacterium]|nr:sulfatase-like hydrolase/transferase [Bryobacteraceae bacterium]
MSVSFRWFAALCAFPLLAIAAPRTPVILISIDTLRADHLSAYGYRAVRTPNLDAYAEHGTLFEHADAQVPLTLPSHASLLTSTYPFENRIEENAEPVPAGAATLASALRANGYATAAFVSSVFLEKQMGLDNGFDFYDSPFHYTVLSALSGSMFFGDTSRNPYAGSDRRVGGLTVLAAEQWLEAHRDEPVFAFLHLYDMHRPWRLPPGFSPSAGVKGYDAQLEYEDHILGSFRRFLAERGWWDRSLVVLLADHGESLGEHGEANHGYFIYESTLAVPLIIHWPSGVYPPKVDVPAGLIDVAPTILDYLRLPQPASFEGHSLLESGAERPVYAESMHSHDAFGWSPLRSIRSGRWKYIEAPHPELYDLAADPHEQRNVVAANSERAGELRSQLSKLLARYPPHGAAPAAARPETALLQSLGYLAPGPRSHAAGSNADPKDRLPEFQHYEDAMIDAYEGRLAQTIIKLRGIVAADPQNTLARRDLGASYLERHQYALARAQLERVAAVAAGDYMTQYELGIADEHLGLLPQAVEHLRTASRLAPDAEQCRRELASVEARLRPR